MESGEGESNLFLYLPLESIEMISMKQRILLSLNLFLLTMIGISCTNSSSKATFAKGFEGMYVGVLPCADCPGIETHITFLADSTLALTSHYLESEGTSLTEWGVWTIENELLKANLGNEHIRYFGQKSDASILMTDSLGKSSATLEEHYLLQKEEPKTIEDFLGQYAQGDLEVEGAYVQFLDIAVTDEGELSVSISYSGNGKGCTFAGKGHLINDQIEVDLSEHHEKFNSTMVIRFVDEHTLLVAPSKFDDRYDLMYFCGGGGSLCGDYHKVEE